MDKLVLLREQIDAMNDVDFQSFVISTGRHSLTTLIFQGLLHQMIHNQSQEELTAINQTVKNVMKIRLEKQKLLPAMETNADDEPDPIHINDLPDVMLSEISSFLLFRDQLKFERVNRSIFIGSRSSSLPQHSMTTSLLKKWILYLEEHPNSIYSHHRHFKSLEIDCNSVGTVSPDDECQMVFPSISIPFIKKVYSLTIRSDYDDDLSSMLNALVLNQCDSFPNIKQLRVLPVDDPENVRSFDPALRLLVERCNNLEYFEFDQNLCEEVDMNDFEWIRNLKGIAFHVENPLVDDLEEEEREFNDKAIIYNSVHSKITDRLESLHLCHPRAISAINCTLVNLEELCIHRIFHNETLNKRDFRFWLKYDLRNLKRLNLDWIPLGEMMGDEGNNHALILWLRKMLETMEYLRCGCRVTNALRILQIALNKISVKKTDTENTIKQ